MLAGAVVNSGNHTCTLCTQTSLCLYLKQAYNTCTLHELDRNKKNGNGTILLHSPVIVTLKVMVSIPAGLTAVTEYSPLSLGS